MLASLRVTFIRICIIIMKLNSSKEVVRRNMVNGEELSQAVAKQLSNETYWHIYRQRYEVDGWPAASKQIQKAPIEELHVCKKRVYKADNVYPRMVKELAGIVFPNLTTLSLIHNAIESLQPLILLQANQLQKLYLSRNCLRRVSPLRKANFPNLKMLVLNDNPIVDCQSLTECDFKHLQFLMLQNWDDSNPICQQQSPLFKLQTKQLYFVGLKSASRIFRKVIQTHYFSRFQSLW